VQSLRSQAKVVVHLKAPAIFRAERLAGAHHLASHPPAGPVQCQPYPAHSLQGGCTLASGQSPHQDLDTDGFQERLPGLNGGSVNHRCRGPRCVTMG
jgi:hypothetical protein